MNPYDKVHELVRAIKDSDEVKQYMQIKEELYADDKNKEMIKNFRDMQTEVQSLLMQGKEADEEKMEKLQSLYQILVANPKIKEFFDKEVQFDVMLSDIYKIIGEGLKDILE
ncbi:MAG: YlbF family regulator [Clostridia bacterium]|nr:YlbF family regulator [Clostridia bacterium]